MANHKILQDDDNFLVEVINWQGKTAVKKSLKPSTPAERVKRLQNEAYGLNFFAELAAKHPQIDLHVPKLYEANQEFIITEYIDCPPVGDNPHNLEKLARVLAEIDRIEPYGEAKLTPSFDYHDIRSRFPKYTEHALKLGLISQTQIDKANEILDSLVVYLTPRIAHGDLSAEKHAFMVPDGKIAFIDFEVFTPQAARYYDVARVYCRLYSFAKSTAAPKQFLADFLSLAEETEHRDEQLMAILIQRAVGMQRDAVFDYKDGVDYRQRARELLEIALKNDLKIFYS